MPKAREIAEITSATSIVISSPPLIEYCKCPYKPLQQPTRAFKI
jgi:hypothetical protein